MSAYINASCPSATRRAAFTMGSSTSSVRAYCRTWRASSGVGSSSSSIATMHCTRRRRTKGSSPIAATVGASSGSSAATSRSTPAKWCATCRITSHWSGVG